MGRSSWCSTASAALPTARSRTPSLPSGRTETARVVLDLRGNGGGDFDRMRRVASLFTGPRDGAIRLLGRGGATDVTLPPPLRAIGYFEIDVMIGPGTASSAEVLAALLRRHASARLIGAPTLGKDWLTRLVPVDHDWRLAIPAERIEVPGETLAQGLAPDIEAAPDERQSRARPSLADARQVAPAGAWNRRTAGCRERK